MKKMVMAVVHRDLTEPILRNLLDAGLTATFSESRGGMLRQSQHKLYIAVEEEQLDKVFSIIKNACHERSNAANINISEGTPEPTPAETATGDAVVFVWDLDRMERF